MTYDPYGQGRTKEELTDIIRALRGRIAELEAEVERLTAGSECQHQWKPIFGSDYEPRNRCVKCGWVER